MVSCGLLANFEEKLNSYYNAISDNPAYLVSGKCLDALRKRWKRFFYYLNYLYREKKAWVRNFHPWSGIIRKTWKMEIQQQRECATRGELHIGTLEFQVRFFGVQKNFWGLKVWGNKSFRLKKFGFRKVLKKNFKNKNALGV